MTLPSLIVGCVGVNPAWDGASGSGDGGSETSSTGAAATDESTESSSGPPAVDLGSDVSDSGETAETGDPTDAWWDPTWGYRRRLTLDNTAQDETLSGFVVRVDISPDSFDYGRAAPDGSDLRFVDEDGTTTLPYEIERWAPGDASVVWVRVPEIAAASEDSIWLYYGGDGGDVQDASATWAGYALVLHLDEAFGEHVDSAGGATCTWTGPAFGQNATGRAGGANDFDGNGAAVDCGTNPTPDTTDSTVTVWVRLALTGDNEQAVISYENLTNPYSGLGLAVRRSDGAVGKFLDGWVRYTETATHRVSADEWAFVTIRGHRDPREGYVTLSVDAAPAETVFSGSTQSLAVEPGTPLTIGSWYGPGGSADTRGIIDEVRISTVERSDAWIAAQYLSQRSAFVTLGPEEAL